jgi:hypothetical protein
MSRSTILSIALTMVFHCTQGLATPGEQPPARGHPDWRSNLCANCPPPQPEAASRIGGETRIATKLVAPNTCADPGTMAWFAEEEDHVSAFLNSSVIRYK